MQAAAAQERERIHAGVGEEEATQVEKVRTRAAAELAALKQGADDDMRRVESWCDEQIRQIRLEASRRIEARGRELELSVSQHGSLIETEEQSVHGAVAGYRESLDAFFARLAEEDEPSAIAGLAGTLPDAPDLDAVRADARTSAMKALEEQESAQAEASANEGPTDEGPTNEAPTDEGPTNEGPTNDGPTNEGPTNEGPADDGAIDQGPTNEAPTSEGATDAPGATDEGATDDGQTNEAPTSEGATDAPGALPPSVEELVPVMELEPEIEPLPVMDPDAAESSHESMAFRVLHSLTNRTSSTGAPEDKGTDARP